MIRHCDPNILCGGTDMKLLRHTSALALAVIVSGTAASAYTLQQAAKPAETPPASYRSDVYVDSRGCAYVRANIGSSVNWVPRLSSDRKTVICGLTPSASGSGTASARPPAPPAPPRPSAPASPDQATTTAAASPSAPPEPAASKPDDKWGEVPCAFVELKEGAAASEEELIAFARERLAGFKTPKRVIFLELPKTSTGKIQKFELRALVKEL